eukprot:12234296-Alexandrium_andersonii.AAC.1
MSASLVGSEMCIRDRGRPLASPELVALPRHEVGGCWSWQHAWQYAPQRDAWQRAWAGPGPGPLVP